MLLFASASPSLLYGVYQAEWRFSTITLTGIFAVYALVLLVTLLFFGSLSDSLGRRPVILIGLGFTLVMCAVFLVADGAGLLFLARALQGAAVGVATGALGGALLELQPKGSKLGPLLTSQVPSVGLAVGAIVTSVLVQDGPIPTHLVWWLLLGIFSIAVVAVVAMPESIGARRGPVSLRPQVGIPGNARATFFLTLPALVAVWALGGFYLSLGPSLARDLAGSRNLLWGGLAIFLLTGIGAAAAFIFRTLKPSKQMVAGCLALLLGGVLSLVAILTTSVALFLVSTAVAGVGYGVGFSGVFLMLGARAPSNKRSSLVAAVYIVAYLAVSIPAIVAGVGVSRIGLHKTALVYSAVIAALSAAAAGIFLLRRPPAPPEARAQTGMADLPPGPCTVPPSRRMSDSAAFGK